MTLSVKDLTKRYGVGEQTVLAWIHSGELLAINVGRRAGAKKPRYRIPQAALDEFEARRATTPSVPRSRKKRTEPGVIEFYK
jgi:excisionase family DNA binding protein